MKTINIPKEVATEIVIHNNEKRIKLIFDYNNEIINKVRKIEDARWSATLSCWHIPFSAKYLLVPIYESAVNTTSELKILNDRHSYYGYNFRKAILNVNKLEGIIYVSFTYNTDVINEIKKLTGRWWHSGAKVWSVENSIENLNQLKKIFNLYNYYVEYIQSDFSIHPKVKFKEKAERNKIPKVFLDQLLLENKSTRTIEIYIGFIAQLIKDFADKNIEILTDEELRQYILTHREQLGYSESYQNQMVSAFKAFYKTVYNRIFESNVFPRPKHGRVLPKVLPREDVEKLFHVCHNEKHRMILMLLYGFGLRISELINLKANDLDLERKQLIVYAGKGRKDRVLPIPKVLIPEINKYVKSYLPKVYFIQGQGGGVYNAKSAQNILKLLARRAGIDQKITPHILRHCYATHMLERGTDLRYIQRLLGHNSSKTTEIYTHVSMRKLGDIGSPIDDINF
jgi:integrase/recombinase XerD